MFFVDEDEIAVVQFGDGDVLIMDSHLETHTNIGTISFIDTCGKCSPIGSEPSQEEWDKLREKCKTDDKLNTVVRLVFTRIESIDVLIDRLQCVKEYMAEEVRRGAVPSSKKP